MILTCKHCGTVFERPRTRIYCSKRCAALTSNANREPRELLWLDRARELLDGTRTYAEVGELVGRSEATVFHHLPNRGLRSRSSFERRLDEARRLLVEEQTSYAEASRTTGVDAKILVGRFPGLGWTKEEGGELGRAIQDAEALIRRRPLGTLRA